MPRSRTPRRKRSHKQSQTTKIAVQVACIKRRNPLGECTNCRPHERAQAHIKALKEDVDGYKKAAEDEKKRRVNERRRGNRLKKELEAKKMSFKAAKIETKGFKREAEELKRRLERMDEDFSIATRQFQDKICALETSRNNLQSIKDALQKRCKRLQATKMALKKRMLEGRKTHPSTFTMMWKGRYTVQARSLARILVSTGAAESKVGKALQDIGAALGVEVGKKVDRRSVKRFVLEQGVGANIQLVYEIIKAGSKSYYS